MPLILAVFAPATRVLAERTFNVDTSAGELRARLEMQTGIPPSAQRLALYARSDVENGVSTGDAPLLHAEDASRVPDDIAILSVWNARPHMMLLVRGAAPVPLADDAAVNKFELSPEEYASRSDTVLAYKKKHSLGRFAPDAHRPADADEHVPADLAVGARCEVDASGDTGFPRRGTVRFVGHTKFAGGVWVGVAYDEPVGRNDGSVDGARYFTCAPAYGGFVRVHSVTVGDFAEEEAWEL
ncbi:hypothetical protein MSPP1_003013 [Malassezia sp. CBS 17886]|nr:hypothetical protein MSPP1_003013 [Malassezia sp. CBS 17886]